MTSCEIRARQGGEGGGGREGREGKEWLFSNVGSKGSGFGYSRVFKVGDLR